MKSSLRFLFTLPWFALLPSAVFAQTPEEIARAITLAEPGPEHARLATLAGTWDFVLRVWPMPGAEPVTTRATAENRMILGGRFLESRSAVDMFGMKGEMFSIYGFDRRHGAYTSIGLDTFGTYWVTAAGTSDATGLIVMKGEDTDPAVGHTQVYEFQLRILDADHYELAVVFLDEAHTGGKGPFRMVEVTFTRRK